MKVLMLNGSSHLKGCTYTALTEIGRTLEEQGISYEIFQIGAGPIRDCIACGKCRGDGCVFQDDSAKQVDSANQIGGVNTFIKKAYEADGFVFGTPVYYAHPSGRILSFLDRAFYSSGKGGINRAFMFKPAAAVASARRGGTTASLDALNKYFGIAQMPTVGSTYWNMVHGQTPDDVYRDAEGLQTMRNIGRNMAWMLQCFAAGKEKGIALPQTETGNVTNFIRK